MKVEITKHIVKTLRINIDFEQVLKIIQNNYSESFCDESGKTDIFTLLDIFDENYHDILLAHNPVIDTHEWTDQSEVDTDTYDNEENLNNGFYKWMNKNKKQYKLK